MHGGTHDWIVLNTIKNGLDMPSGEEHLGREIRHYIDYEWESLDYQPVFKKVLDIGSLNVNGTMRTYDFLHPNHKRWYELIGCEEYMGIDIMAGDSVDMVMNAHDLIFKDSIFDLTICVNMLEHDEDPLSTMKEALRVTKQGGLILMVIPNEDVPDHTHLGGGSEHYNHLNKQDVEDLLKQAGYTDYSLIRTYHDHLIKAIKS